MMVNYFDAWFITVFDGGLVISILSNGENMFCVGPHRSEDNYIYIYIYIC